MLISSWYSPVAFHQLCSLTPIVFLQHGWSYWWCFLLCFYMIYWIFKFPTFYIVAFKISFLFHSFHAFFNPLTWHFPLSHWFSSLGARLNSSSCLYSLSSHWSFLQNTLKISPDILPVSVSLNSIVKGVDIFWRMPWFSCFLFLCWYLHMFGVGHFSWIRGVWVFHWMVYSRIPSTTWQGGTTYYSNNIVNIQDTKIYLKSTVAH